VFSNLSLNLVKLVTLMFVCVRTGMLHSNPGDYAWGQGGLDAVITQVVEQDDACACYLIRASVQTS